MIGSDAFSLITAVLAGMRINLYDNNNSHSNSSSSSSNTSDVSADTNTDTSTNADNNVPALSLILDDSTPNKVSVSDAKDMLDCRYGLDCMRALAFDISSGSRSVTHQHSKCA